VIYNFQATISPYTERFGIQSYIKAIKITQIFLSDEINNSANNKLILLFEVKTFEELSISGKQI